MKRLFSFSLIGVVSKLFSATPVLAHGFGKRIDLPIPINQYILGAAATVAVSFFLISFLSPKNLKTAAYPRFNLLKLSIFRFFTNPIVSNVIKTFFVFLLVLILVAGFFGSDLSYSNILPTVVWIIFAIAVVYSSALIGDIWRFINPWKTIHEWFFEEKGLNPYPRSWGVWPAVILFFGYRWIENATLTAADPVYLSAVITVYSGITLTGMSYFGRKNWLKFADPFSVLFRFLSKFSITEFISQGKKKVLNLRPPIVGLAEEDRAGISEIVFILLMLSSIAYDGLKETTLWYRVSSFDYNIFPSYLLRNTLGLLLWLLLFVGIYLLFSFLVKKFANSKESVVTIGSYFIFSLLPIAIGYEIAHYTTILLTEGQRIIYLISDPFGVGWNLFGTAGFRPDYGVIDFITLWNVQIALIVFGHIASVYVAHKIAARVFPQSNLVTRSQYPMLALMVLYTIISLSILSQPLVSQGG